jgi:glycerol-3-phosphate acyltransferase PlsX
MGGDAAPGVVIKGANIARQRFPQLQFLLFGREGEIRPVLSRMKKLESVTTVVHTDAVVRSDEKPSAALRTGRSSSMRLAIDAVRAWRSTRSATALRPVSSRRAIPVR